jgi:purine-cytosine permease-like protein
MKDLIKKTIVIVVFGAFLGYLLYLALNGQSITTLEFAHLNIWWYIILIGICLYIIAFYGIYPLHIKFSRPALLVVSLALIILSQTMLANDGPNGIFIGDIFSVAGVLILILFPTNLIITDKVKKRKAKNEEVVIEV